MRHTAQRERGVAGSNPASLRAVHQSGRCPHGGGCRFESCRAQARSAIGRAPLRPWINAALPIGGIAVQGHQSTALMRPLR